MVQHNGNQIPQLHVPVLVDQVMQYMIPSVKQLEQDAKLFEKLVFIDGTFGQGGYTKYLFQQLQQIPLPLQNKFHIFAIDLDLSVKTYFDVLQQSKPSFVSSMDFVHSSYTVGIESIVKECQQRHPNWKILGSMFDLGVSSMQLDQAERGFSFKKELNGPLDMRMNQIKEGGGDSAADVINNMRDVELTQLFVDYGEIPFPIAKRISQEIVLYRNQVKPIETTQELVQIIYKASPPRHSKKSANSGGIHPCTLPFQALRIFVNNEIQGLKECLQTIAAIPDRQWMERVVVVSYHSLEDRLVKNILGKQTNLWYNGLDKKDLQTASEDEIQYNPRSRSAKLRYFLHK